MPKPPKDPSATVDDPPPFTHEVLKSWPRLYWAVLLALLGWILIFAWVTGRYS